jgi:FixJ family two-component response regulator/mono/diheme cytochrome c family protein
LSAEVRDPAKSAGFRSSDQKFDARCVERRHGKVITRPPEDRTAARNDKSAMKNLSFPGLPRVLVVDDEDGVREGLRALLQKEGVHVEVAGSAEEGVRRLDQRAYDVVFLDLHLPGADGLSMLSQFRRGTAPADVVVLTGYGTVANTVEAMRKGAADVIEKPFAGDRILAVDRRCLEMRQLRNELAWLQDRVRELTATELVGLSPAIREVQTRIDQVAQAPDTTVLVTGQSGAGKELVARCIHERSARRSGPFVAINCAALTEALLEAELFGYEPGAFTGAAREGKDGLFAVAAGGTSLAQAPDTRRSGFAFMGPGTQAMQRDDTANPGMLYVLEGSDLWQERVGAAARSCADCHGADATTMRGVAARHPAYDAARDAPIDLAGRIVACRTERQQAPAPARESRDLLALTAFVAHQSRGTPSTPHQA